ncbi:unnamed protein product [Rotaria socialis]
MHLTILNIVRFENFHEVICVINILLLNITMAIFTTNWFDRNQLIFYQMNARDNQQNLPSQSSFPDHNLSF